MRPDGSVAHAWTRSLALVAATVLVLTLGLRLVIEYPLRLPLWDGFWQRDYAGNLAFTLVVWALVRRTVPTLVFASLVVTGLQLINAAKVLVLGVPGAPEDFANLVNLYRLAEGPGKLAVAAVALVPVLLLVWLVRWRSVATWAVIAVLAGTVALVDARSQAISAALDARFGNSVWNQPGNWRQRGLALHLVQEAVRDASASEGLPSSAEVRDALVGLPDASPSLSGLQRRNVHVIVLESFFDVASLGPAWIPEDPFPPALRELWSAAGNSVALSPTFGGYTANAEFEALCGFPVVEQTVFFEGGLRRRAPCLPRVLAQAGWRTVASHPNVPQFWNRTLAYRLAGFERFLSVADFDTSDAIGDFMLDHALYEQVGERLRELRGTGPIGVDAPVFDYVLTYHGHVPYPSSEAYPDRVTVNGDVQKLHGYANQLWYKSRALVAQIEDLRAADPDALIVAFGDHLPFLDYGFGVYDEVLGLPPEREDFSAAQLEFLSATPLIVIDGARGAIDVGKVPLYRLPSLILGLLGGDDDGAFAWASSPAGTSYRPLYGMHYETPSSADVTGSAALSGAIACTPEAALPECVDGIAWLARVRLLAADLFTGAQHALASEPPGPPGPVAPAVDGGASGPGAGGAGLGGGTPGLEEGVPAP